MQVKMSDYNSQYIKKKKRDTYHSNNGEFLYNNNRKERLKINNLKNKGKQKIKRLEERTAEYSLLMDEI